MWQLTYTHRARKDLLVLDKDARLQILEKLESTAKQQALKLEKLTGYNYFKIRAGEYRAIVVLDYKSQNIEVRRIGPRKKIYKMIE